MAKRKMKILECIRQGLIGGGESHLLVLVENLDREKYEPVVLSFTDGPMINCLNEMGIKNYIIHTLRPFDLRVWRKVKKLLVTEKIDMVHVHGSRANSNVLWAARSLKIPVIYTIHGWSFHPDQPAISRGLRIMGEKYLTSRTDLNISVSESNKQSGKKYISSFESVVINNGIDQGRFNPTGRFKDIRKELRLPPEKVVILFIARFTAHKQPLALIHAFSKAVSKNSQLHLLMVGEGDQKAEGMQLVRKYGIQNNVTFLPFRQDVPDVLAAADIYVLPSLWEGLPIALLEAMAMGKAIIGTDVDGTREVIQDGVNGLLIGTDKLEFNLEEKLVLLSADASLRERLSKNAVNTVKDKYNAKTMTRKIEEIYNRFTAIK